MVRMIVVVACSLAVLSCAAVAQEYEYAELQKNFADAVVVGNKTPSALAGN
jgi:hypothetical protein